MDALNKLKEICEAATPGPWKPSYCEWDCDFCTEDCEKDPDMCGNGLIVRGATVPKIHTVEYDDYVDMNDADATFVATARQALPALIELVEALQESEFYWHERCVLGVNALDDFAAQNKKYRELIVKVDSARRKLEDAVK